jgi:hypothetical protein
VTLGLGRHHPRNGLPDQGVNCDKIAAAGAARHGA